MACTRQSQALPKISRSVWVPGVHRLVLLRGFLDSLVLSGINLDTEFSFHCWLKNSTNMDSVSIWVYFIYTWGKCWEWPHCGLWAPFPHLTGSLPPPCPSSSLISPSLLRSNKHIPLSAPCRAVAVQIRSLRSSACIPPTCQGSFLKKCLILREKKSEEFFLFSSFN